jgi:hypothetical protein
LKRLAAGREAVRRGDANESRCRASPCRAGFSISAGELLLGDRSLAQWHAYLTTDQRTGVWIGYQNVPRSRFGRTAEETAWWAIAAHAAYSYFTGQPWDVDETYDSMNYFMGLAANDNDSLGELVREFAKLLPHELIEQLDWERVDDLGDRVA